MIFRLYQLPLCARHATDPSYISALEQLEEPTGRAQVFVHQRDPSVKDSAKSAPQSTENTAERPAKVFESTSVQISRAGKQAEISQEDTGPYSVDCSPRTTSVLDQADADQYGRQQMQSSDAWRSPTRMQDKLANDLMAILGDLKAAPTRVPTSERTAEDAEPNFVF